MGRRISLRHVRRVLPASLAGVLAGLLITAGPVSHAADSCEGPFAGRLSCLADRAGAKGGSEVVTRIGEPLPVVTAGDRERSRPKPDLKLARHEPALDRGMLVVEVPGKGATGAGGTVLLVLAEERRVSPDSLITRLDAEYVRQLRVAGACRVKGLCELVGRQDVPGSRLIEDGFADRLEPADVESSPVGTLLVAVGAGLLLLTVLFGLAVRRSRGTGEPRTPAGPVPQPAGGPSAVADPYLSPHPARSPLPVRTPGGRTAPGRHRRPGEPVGPIRQAFVRTALHPQGYVEVEQCLHRAVWADPAVPPPAPGALVDVMDDARGRDPAVLLAFPPHEGRRISGEVHAR